MKKKEFLKKLRKKLEILESSEVDDIIIEYEGYIDEKMESGVSEEDAVNSFGDVDELASELLRAYKIKVKKETDPIGDFTKKAINIINQIVNDISEKSLKEIIRFIFEICVLLFVIALCHLPVSMLISLGRDVFDILSGPINRIFFMIWKFVLEFAYFVLSILVFARIFDKRYLKKTNLVKEEPSKEIAKKKNTYSKVKPVKKEKSFLYDLGEVIVKIGVIFLKFMAICILFGASAYLIGMACILGICIYLLIQGITYFGIYLVMVALFLLGIIFFQLLFNFVIDKKNNGLKLFINIMVSIILLGGGCAIATFEVAETEFINSVPNDLTIEVLTEELSMTKNTVFLGNISNYKVDNELKNVKIEYEYYPLGTKMRTDITKKNDFVYLRWDLERIYIKTDLLKHMINDLKEKKVYNYNIEPTITIIANEENIAKIKKNRQKYYENQTHYTSCEFVRTYQVEMIKPSHEEDEIIVVLSQYLEDDLVPVRLKKEYENILEVGSSYEFTFKTYQAYVDTDIENVFSENEILNIKKTTKTGVSQRQDNACTIFY